MSLGRLQYLFPDPIRVKGFEVTRSIEKFMAMALESGAIQYACWKKMGILSVEHRYEPPCQPAPLSLQLGPSSVNVRVPSHMARFCVG